ncbi:MAG: hypothetical protein ABS81_03720 [Pseudonocardia sp. SCN 72-86]|uniref:TadE/TadG family type IV pilus assembly protein n=1 Tax=uncultured Microbacterium sp. TaxID=191216 RepID=UPI00086F499A|nr:pilus assembly protein TadG-related protein [uncultured Microbacterium sp.]ODU06735.1 MAG: hypothetical protein ABS81_03720 [Pseudonocardia sp. SCN 72-86]
MSITKLHRTIARLHSDERGSISVIVIGCVVFLVLIVGLVVDSSGKYQASQDAQMTAASAARAGTNALAGQAVVDGTLQLNGSAAQVAAQNYLTAAGLEGTVSVVGDTITVSVEDTYTTRFLSIIGINSLPVGATSSARIITQ